MNDSSVHLVNISGWIAHRLPLARESVFRFKVRLLPHFELLPFVSILGLTGARPHKFRHLPIKEGLLFNVTLAVSGQLLNLCLGHPLDGIH